MVPNGSRVPLGTWDKGSIIHAIWWWWTGLMSHSTALMTHHQFDLWWMNWVNRKWHSGDIYWWHIKHFVVWRMSFSKIKCHFEFENGQFSTKMANFWMKIVGFGRKKWSFFNEKSWIIHFLSFVSSELNGNKYLSIIIGEKRIIWYLFYEVGDHQNHWKRLFWVYIWPKLTKIDQYGPITWWKMVSAVANG